MATRVIGHKVFILIAVMAMYWGASLYSAWQMSLSTINTGTGGATISSTAYLGENSNATNGYDWNYDVPLGPPPQNQGYVRIYFPHSDFGAYNGNYLVDIRATNPVQKTWAVAMAVNNPLSTSYSLAWSIPPLMPDYYQPKLLIGSTTVNMRNQSSYVYTGFVSTCSVRLDLAAGMPYLLAIPPDFQFSDNQPQRLNLRRYFSVLSGNLSFSYSANPNLNQSLVTIGDSLYWQLSPVHGYVGSTTVNLIATGSGGSKTVVITVHRDSTNSPPQFEPPSFPLQISEGSSGLFQWGSLISDVDLDEVVVTCQGNSDLQVQLDGSNQAVLINPVPGFLGSTSFALELNDGVNPLQTHQIPVQVNPLVPHSVQQISISAVANGMLQLSWQPVSQSTLGIPIYDLEYKVSIYADPACTQLMAEQITENTGIELLPQYQHAFITITVINQ